MQDSYLDAEQSLARLEANIKDLRVKYSEAVTLVIPAELSAITVMEDEDEVVLNDLVKRLRGELIPKKEVRQVTSGQSSGLKSAHLERVKLPEFDGKFESWPMFKQEWMDLQRDQNTTDAIQLRQLREKLPKSAKEMISGMSP